MGFLDDLSAADPVASAFSGREGAELTLEAAEIQAQSGREAIQDRLAAAERAQGFFQPFADVGQRGVEASQFLANPQAQFDLLQNNPLFASALESRNRQTQARASASGRLGAGGTLEQLSNNVLLAADPFLNRQREDATNLLNLGTNLAGAQANIETGQAAGIADLTTGVGAAIAAGEVGSANARTQGAQNALAAGLTGLEFLSNRGGSQPQSPLSAGGNFTGGGLNFSNPNQQLA